MRRCGRARRICELCVFPPLPQGAGCPRSVRRGGESKHLRFVSQRHGQYTHQRCQSSIVSSLKLREEQPPIPFDYAQGRLSTRRRGGESKHPRFASQLHGRYAHQDVKPSSFPALSFAKSNRRSPSTTLRAGFRLVAAADYAQDDSAGLGFVLSQVSKSRPFDKLRAGSGAPRSCSVSPENGSGSV